MSQLLALGYTAVAIYLIVVHDGDGTSVGLLIAALMTAGTAAINILGSLVITFDEDAAHRLVVAFSIVPECSFIKIVKIVLDIVFAAQALNEDSYTSLEQKFAGGIALTASIMEVSMHILSIVISVFT